MSSKSICNHTRDKQIGLTLHHRPISIAGTELDSTQSYYHYSNNKSLLFLQDDNNATAHFDEE